MEQKVQYLAFNRGMVSRHALARADVKRLALSAETMTNWIPKVLGPMTIRPGLGYLYETKDNAEAKYIPFIFSVSQKASIELTDSVMRVAVSDTIITRPSVSTTITNGNFTSDLTGWTDGDESGATSEWVTGGRMQMTGTGTTFAIRTATVTVAVADSEVEHALRIVVDRGPVILRVGSTSGDDDYISETTLGTGTHSLSLTPTGNFYIQFKSSLERIVRIESCTIEAAGDMELPTSWTASDLDYIRHDQSGDVIYVACDGYRQYKIERRATRSWSIVKYQPEDGPFRVENVGPGTLTPSVLNGNGTLTASLPTFDPGHVGALFSITSVGQIVQSALAAENTFTDYIKVEGVKSKDNNDRQFTIDITGTFSATVQLQRSYGNPGNWVDVNGQSWTATTAGTTYADKFDNQVVYYRAGIKTGAYTSGTATVKLTYEPGSIRGVCRITAYSTSTLVDMEVLSSFGGFDAATIWEEGKWSTKRGYPTAVKLHEGRLWWMGRDSIDGSVSDGYESFDHTVEGDSAPISRTLGRGPIDVINWALSLNRMVVGGQGAEYSCKSSTLDEPLTATNFNIKTPSTNGSAPVQALEIDSGGVYIQRGGIRVFGVQFDTQSYDYASDHLSALIPEIGEPGIVRMAVQRQPDTRVHLIRSDGTVAMLVFDKLENVNAFCEIETDGEIEDAWVLPGDAGDPEDHVYYVVKRTINGSTKRYVEKWAFEEACLGAATNKLADSFVVYSGAATTSITGLDHLEGEQVVVWADSADVGYDSDDALIYTVSGGAITLATAASTVIVGLPYTAQWKSGKLVQINTQTGTGIKHNKNIKGLGLIMTNTHYKGLKFGKDFSNLDDLPSYEDGYTVAADTVHTDYDTDTIVFPGTWTTDARLCLQAKAPRPATVLAAIAEVEHHG